MGKNIYKYTLELCRDIPYEKMISEKIEEYKKLTGFNTKVALCHMISEAPLSIPADRRFSFRIPSEDRGKEAIVEELEDAMKKVPEKRAAQVPSEDAGEQTETKQIISSDFDDLDLGDLTDILSDNFD